MTCFSGTVSEHPVRELPESAEGRLQPVGCVLSSPEGMPREKAAMDPWQIATSMTKEKKGVRVSFPQTFRWTPALLKEMAPYHTRMNTSAHHPAEDLCHFTLEGLLPPTHTLTINPATRTAILFSHSPTQTTHIVAQQHFSPNSMRVLVPLLAAYPHYCAYDTILAHLFSIALDDARRLLLETWEIAIRPIRRAISTLAVSLHAFGLCIRNIRGVGYLVEALANLSSQTP